MDIFKYIFIHDLYSLGICLHKNFGVQSSVLEQLLLVIIDFCFDQLVYNSIEIQR